MKREVYPILLCATEMLSEGVKFSLPDKKVEVFIPRTLAKRIIEMCDGTGSLSSIISELGKYWTKASLLNLINALFKKGVLIDSKNISPLVLRFIQNPTSWGRELNRLEIEKLILDQRLQTKKGLVAHVSHIAETEWTAMLQRRCSIRVFGGEGVSEESLARILWSAYGTIESSIPISLSSIYRRTVPSAGALFPLLIHLVLLKDAGQVQSGVYRIFFSEPGQVEFVRCGGVTKDVKTCFVDPRFLQTVAGVIVVSGSVARSADKYANRGLSYTFLEAGHVAQNIHLTALHEDVATLEVGGFYEGSMRKLLSLPTSTCPIITVVFGTALSKNETPSITRIKDASNIVRMVKVSPKKTSGYSIDFSIAFAQAYPSHGTKKVSWSCGRSKDVELAKTKATAECIEWFACGQSDAHKLIEGTYVELKNQAIHPEQMIQYLPDQFQTKKVYPFSNKGMYQWREVIEYETEKKRLILADFVYFPYYPRHRRYAYANSCGTAAHATVEKALEHALLELVEREAFMVMWLNRLSMPVFDRKTLPSSIQQRIRVVERHGFTVQVVDLTFDLTPVVFAVARSEQLPFLTCSAASSYNPEEALERAFMELEAAVYCRFRDGKTKKALEPPEVQHPLDHGAFYEDKRRIRKALFLFGDERQKKSFSEVKQDEWIQSFEGLCSEISNMGLSLHFVHLNQEDPILESVPYQVVKAFVPGMTPMSFGYGLEPCGLDRVRSLPVRCEFLKKERRTSQLNRLIHPFT